MSSVFGLTQNRDAAKRIATITANSDLAQDIVAAIAFAQTKPYVHLMKRGQAWDIFRTSLDAAARDIREHPRRDLFQRLIQFGPLHPDAPPSPTATGEGALSDAECGQCVEFIFSHMVNRFKGELAEWLALKPFVELVDRLRALAILPENTQVYWGDAIREPRRLTGSDTASVTRYGSFAKGADGLLVCKPGASARAGSTLTVKGIVEIKSMRLPCTRLRRQIQRHLTRLQGGVQLAGTPWKARDIEAKKPLSILIMPSAWRLNRECRWITQNRHRALEVATTPPPEAPPAIEKLGGNEWLITLAWSQEALEQAAYEMTYWYMAQVGQSVFDTNTLPSAWQEMMPDEAGQNAIKMMLYYMMLRPLSKRQHRRAVKLYNVYGFGYPLGVDSKRMLWPEDFRHNSSV